MRRRYVGIFEKVVLRCFFLQAFQCCGVAVLQCCGQIKISLVLRCGVNSCPKIRGAEPSRIRP